MLEGYVSAMIYIIYMYSGIIFSIGICLGLSPDDEMVSVDSTVASCAGGSRSVPG